MSHNLTVTRTFNAPIAAVWNAWTDSALVKQWWGPRGFTCPVAEMDVRIGGSSLICMRAPKEWGGQDKMGLEQCLDKMAEMLDRL